MNCIEQMREEMVLASNEKTCRSSKTFFKEDIKVYGVKSADARRISKKYLRTLCDVSKQEMFSLCRELLETQYLELSIAACDWSRSMRKQFSPDDFTVFEQWIDSYVTNWAVCDTFCNHTVGDFIVMYPQFIDQLKRWAHSDNRWLRRAAAVSLIVPAKRGEFLQDILEIADIMLLDTDDMVQKGYGWMLKAATEKHTRQVYDYVLSKKEVMPRTALRYAIEKMPKELKINAMKK